MNVYACVGTVSDPPIIGETKNNKPMVKFNIHVKYGSADYPKSTFVKCQAFGYLAQAAEHLSHGSLVSFTGELGGFAGEDGKWVSTFTATAINKIETRQTGSAPSHEPTAPPATQRAMAKALDTPPDEAFGGGFDDGFSDSIPF